MASKNERKTENVVRDQLRALGYFDSEAGIEVEEQKSQIEAVRRLMRAASKSGQGGIGSPEFIVSSATTPDFLLVIECKANTKDHVSEAAKERLVDNEPSEAEPADAYSKRVQRYAVDGVVSASLLL